MIKPRWVPDNLSATESDLEEYKERITAILRHKSVDEQIERIEYELQSWQRREAKLAAWAIDGEDDYQFKIPIDAYQIRSLEMWLESLLTKLENEKKHAAGSGSKKTDDPSAQIEH